MKVIDKVNLEMEICSLIELVIHIADGTEVGDTMSQILVDATPQKVREFICEELGGWKG